MRNVLFLCTGNSCRSQMAEGCLRHLAGDQFNPLSGGLEPSTVNPLAIKVMAEVGIDISRHRSKDVWEFRGRHIPYLVTVCDSARDRCPIFPGISFREHWSVPDPAPAPGTEAERLVVFRAVRDEIGQRVRGFVEKYGVQPVAQLSRAE